MNRKIISVLAFSLMTTIGIFTAQTITAQATTPYGIVKSKNYTNKLPAYYLKSSNKSAYIWNNTLTKKLYSLKNYPKTTWYVTNSYKMTNGKKTGTFYRIRNVSNSRTGLVWRNYLARGTNPQVSVNNYKLGDRYYKYDNDFINAFSKEATKLFPGTIYSPKIGKIISRAYGRDLDQNSSLESEVKKLMGTETAFSINAYNIQKPLTLITLKKNIINKSLIISNSGKQSTGFNQFNKYYGWHIGILIFPNGTGTIVLTK